MARPASQHIGAAHERLVRRLLDDWSVRYIPKPRFPTSAGSTIEFDFLLPATADRPHVVLECKDFGVTAKNPRDSQRHKTQEALWLLLQAKKYCAETKGARLVLITGRTPFRPEQEALLKAELGDDFHIVAIADSELFRRLVTADR